ncbi:35196_t:CDS:1, partial [Racocetra persica]
QKPWARIAFQCDNKSWIVREVDIALDVLDLYSILTPINLKTIKTKFDPHARYYPYQQNKNSDICWVPLLPGYTVYTLFQNKFFQFKIVKDKNNQICFEWYDFDNDSTFQNLQENRSDYTAYRSLKYKYNSEKKLFPWIMGFLNNDNILFLQNIVTRHFSHIFDQYNQTIKAFQKETRLENTMKHVAHELNNKIGENELPITNGILLERHSKYSTPQETQALMVKYNELVQKNYTLNRKIQRLQQKITELTHDNEQFDTEENFNKLLEVIDENINKAKLGSTILIDSKKYLLLVFSQPYINCGNNQISKRTHIVDTIGFSVKCQIICHLCGETMENNNEPKNIHFTKAVSAAALAGGLTYPSLQSIFSCIGITSQSCRKNYYLYQTPLFSYLVINAKKSTTFWLEKALEFMKQKNVNYLSVSFDCSWSHERNARQA